MSSCTFGPARVLLALPLLSVACVARTVEEIAGDALTKEPIVTVFPQDGARSLQDNVPVLVVLGEAAQGDLPDVSVDRHGERVDLNCALDDDGILATCGPVRVEKGDGFALDVVAGEGHVAITGTTEPPEPGVGWDVLDGPVVDRLGSGDDAAGLMTKQLQGQHLFAGIPGYDGEAGEYDLVFGPVFPQDDFLNVAEPGLGGVFPVEVDEDGQIRGEAVTVWLPVPMGDRRIPIFGRRAEVSGRIDEEGRLHDLDFDTVLPAMSLQRLVAPLGEAGEILLDLVDLDADLDGDGTPDGAWLSLAGDADAAMIGAWTEE